MPAIVQYCTWLVAPGIETVFQIAIGKHFTVFPDVVLSAYVGFGIKVSGIYTCSPIALYVNSLCLPIAGTLHVRTRASDIWFFTRVFSVFNAAAKQKLEVGKKERGTLRAALGNQGNK